MDDRERWFVHIYQATYVDTYRALTHLVAKHPILRNEFDEILEDTYLEAIRALRKAQTAQQYSGMDHRHDEEQGQDALPEKRRVLDRLGLRVEVDDDFSMVADNVTPEHIYIEKETGEGLRRGIVRLIGEDGYAILRALTKPPTARIALIYKKSEAILASGGGFAEPFGIVKSSRPWRQILPQAKFPSSAALASCGHLRPCKLPWMQVQLPWGGFAEPYGIVKSSRLRRQILPLAKFPCLRAFSTLCQSVDFVNILSRPREGRLIFVLSGDRGHSRRERRPDAERS